MDIGLKAKIAIFVLMILLFQSSGLIFAGTEYELKCQNQACAYSNEMSWGGGFVFMEISGYCDHCKKFVSVRWQRSDSRDYSGLEVLSSTGLPPEPPRSLGLAQSPITGETAPTYPCPHCSGPFAEIKSIPKDHLLYCPKCRQKTLKAEESLFYD